jgi:hypothetical protein
MAAGIPSNYQVGQKVTPAQAAANYQSGASTKGQKWATNTLRPKVDPFDAAAAAADTCVANFNTVGAAGIRAGLARVNRQQIATLISTQGPTLYSQGIANKGAPRYAASAQGLIPALQQIASNLPPRGTSAQNDQRMLQQVAGARALRGQFRSK